MSPDDPEGTRRAAQSPDTRDEEHLARHKADLDTANPDMANLDMANLDKREPGRRDELRDSRK